MPSKKPWALPYLGPRRAGRYGEARPVLPESKEHGRSGQRVLRELGRSRPLHGVTSALYERDLEANLRSLLERAKSGRYHAPPVRRVHVPQAGSPTPTRPIGMLTLEDKVLPRAVALLLDPICERDFPGCWYGLRAGRRGHQALERRWKGTMDRGGGWERTWHKWWSRRNRERSMTWDRFKLMLERYPLPAAVAVDSTYRFAAQPRADEPYALMGARTGQWEPGAGNRPGPTGHEPSCACVGRVVTVGCGHGQATAAKGRKLFVGWPVDRPVDWLRGVNRA